MARNDIYLNINALSPADAVVTGQQDMTAATIPELVLGDTPTFNFYFTDNTNVWPSWAGNATYTLTWALSDAVAGDFAPAATTSAATAITGGWSVVLPLNAYDLVGLLNTKRVGQPFPVQNLWQQLRVTDPSGNEITRAMFWTPVRYRAISDTQNSESASPTGARFVAVNNVNELTTPTAAQFYAANPVPTSALGTAANGELLIGNGTGFTKSTLTAGDGITITNAAGSITIDASAAQEKLTATIKNAESTPITKGQVVYLFGATGNVASVKLAYNTSDATSAKTFGVVSSSSISAGGTGLVTCVGVVDGLNLGAYQDGDTLYLGATPGSVTATKPYAPNHLVYVGVVERANSGNGELYVKVQNGYELDEIHDVQINAPRQSGQTLIYDNTTSLWKNARITAGTNIGVTNGDGSISIAFSGTLPVANGGTGVTTSTGSGSVVLSTSPTLTTPILGTPQSGTLTTCTGLPISSGVSGLGTNVASALGTNVGSVGALVVNGGALGTPSSGTLSSCSGLPISTGVSGLGTNVATFLATPSSANLAAAVTDETGSGALVFANTPTLVTPNIGAATGTSLTTTGNLTAADLILGTSGPSVKSTLSARAPRQGLVFDGTAGGSFTLTSAPSGEWSTDQTVLIQTANPSTAVGLFSIGGTYTTDAAIVMYLSTGGALIVEQNTAAPASYRTATISGFRSAYSGKTVRIATTVSSGTLTIYVNGVSASYSETTFGGSPPAWGATLGSSTSYFGKLAASNYYFNSGLGPLYIYNRALSASEVVALYESGAPSAGDYPAQVANTALITGNNSTFAGAGNWTNWDGTISVGSGVGSCTAGTTSFGGHYLSTFLNLNIIKAGVRYRLTMDIGSLSGGNVEVINTGTKALLGIVASSNGTGKTVEFTATTDDVLGISSSVSGATWTMDNVTLVPLGLLLAPDAAQAGGGLVWYDTSGNAANIALPGSGVAWSNASGYYQEGTCSLTASSTSGTITSSTVTAYYTKVGRLVTISGYVDITNNGTGSGQLKINGLPFAAAYYASAGAREGGTHGQALSMITDPGLTHILVYKYDNSYPVATGSNIPFTFTYIM